MSEIKTRTYVPNEIKEERFEFVLYVNNHIICQRFFPINNFDETMHNQYKSKDLTKKYDYETFLKSNDYNTEVNNSYLLKELMDNIIGINNGQWGDQGIIPAFLKEKSINYLWENHNEHYVQTEETLKNSIRKVDMFQFDIKIDKKVVVSSKLQNYFYPLSAVNTVKIKEIIPSIMAEIRLFLGKKKLW